jgi:hypothetical protein
MKKLICLAICAISVSFPVFAQSKVLAITQPMTYLSSYGGTHNVKPYFRRDGTFVQGHRAGNPRSGIHCHDNVC